MIIHIIFYVFKKRMKINTNITDLQIIEKIDSNLLLPESSIIITDSNLAIFYPELINNYRSIIIKAGEEYKSFATIEQIQKFLLKEKVDRSDLLVGLGGGVICDITGFASAIYKRGISHWLIPTSLLAMCDAAIGGKNAVNLDNSKNICGTFKQAEKTIIYLDFLKTLPNIELKNGYIEILKIAMLTDDDFYCDTINCGITTDEIIQNLLIKAIRAKINIVEKDFTEQGIRKILNFGHTLGHAIEAEYSLPHGIAVANGLLQALKLSIKILNLDVNIYNDVRTKFEQNKILIIENLKLQEMESYLFNDKKVQSSKFDFILLEGIAKPVIKKIDLSDLKTLLINESI